MSKKLEFWIFSKDTGQLHSEVYQDSRFPDGSFITTSPVVKIDDGIVTTQSGTNYVLGKSYISSVKDIEEYLSR